MTILDAARCAWVQGAAPDYLRYHDEEWGRPVSDDTRLFEKLCLEGFQSGLSWLTILRKRDAFRAAFAGFEIDAVAEFGAADVARLLGDAGIVRHRGKIEAAIGNAKAARKLRDECGSLAAYVWRYEPDDSERPARLSAEVLRGMTTSVQSVALSRDLKRRGWSFVGPTTMYAFMQSMGLVNDHLEECCVRQAVQEQRSRFVRPR
ncbi:MAG TPA: DNA-3-methyladenine glycosylase I [Burkholderiaceae bacterium]|jgi:DNA-3-methyladenine glycosylase I|nr:DNA-3-methyladenine glycosylase I [Burkholderiaceae bacterium]